MAVPRAPRSWWSHTPWKFTRSPLSRKALLRVEPDACERRRSSHSVSTTLPACSTVDDGGVEVGLLQSSTAWRFAMVTGHQRSCRSGRRPSAAGPVRRRRRPPCGPASIGVQRRKRVARSVTSAAVAGPVVQVTFRLTLAVVLAHVRRRHVHAPLGHVHGRRLDQPDIAIDPAAGIPARGIRRDCPGGWRSRSRAPNLT